MTRTLILLSAFALSFRSVPTHAEHRSTLIDETAHYHEIQRLQAEIQRLKTAPGSQKAQAEARANRFAATGSLARPAQSNGRDPATDYPAAVEWLVGHKGNSILPDADSTLWKLLPESLVLNAVKELKGIDDNIKKRTDVLEGIPSE